MSAPGARPHVEARHNLPAGLGLPHLYSRAPLCCLRLFLGDGLTTSTSGGGVHVHTLPRRVAAPPQVLRNLSVQLQWEGLHDENLFVGASPVVDYLLSCWRIWRILHFIVFQESRCGGVSSDPEIQLECGANRREVFML